MVAHDAYLVGIVSVAVPLFLLAVFLLYDATRR